MIELRQNFDEVSRPPSGECIMRMMPGASVEAQKRKRMMREVEVAGRQGGTGANQHTKETDSKGNNITSAKTIRGTKKDYVISRLKRDQAEDPKAADLLNRIEAGEVSVHAAAIEAGIRRPMRSVPVDSPDNAIRALARIFTAEQLQAAAIALTRATSP